jgi:hypothetical protein
MRNQRPISFLFFFGIACLLFLIDLGTFSFFEKPFIYSLLCFYILQLAKSMGISRVVFSCILLSLNPLIYYGRFGINLLYLLPATLLGIQMRHILYDSLWQYYALLIGCILAQIWLVEWWVLGLPISLSYTISTILVNLLIIWIMSLKSYN